MESFQLTQAWIEQIVLRLIKVVRILRLPWTLLAYRRRVVSRTTHQGIFLWESRAFLLTLRQRYSFTLATDVLSYRISFLHFWFDIRQIVHDQRKLLALLVLEELRLMCFVSLRWTFDTVMLARALTSWNINAVHATTSFSSTDDWRVNPFLSFFRRLSSACIWDDLHQNIHVVIDTNYQCWQS